MYNWKYFKDHDTRFTPDPILQVLTGPFAAICKIALDGTSLVPA